MARSGHQVRLIQMIPTYLLLTISQKAEFMPGVFFFFSYYYHVSFSAGIFIKHYQGWKKNTRKTIKDNNKKHKKQQKQN